MRECAESSEQGVRTLSPAPSAAVSPVAMAVSTKLHSSSWLGLGLGLGVRG